MGNAKYRQYHIRDPNNKNKQFKGLFVQDKQTSGKAFEVATPRVGMFRCHIQIANNHAVFLMCEDYTGQSETIRFPLHTMHVGHLKNFTVNGLANITVVMVDKDFKRRCIIKNELPILICLFHTSCTFRRLGRLHVIKWLSQQVTWLELIQKLTYSSSEGEYKKLHGGLKSNCPKINVIEYFNHSCMAPFEKDEWVLGLMVECGSFVNMTYG